MAEALEMLDQATSTNNSQPSPERKRLQEADHRKRKLIALGKLAAPYGGRLTADVQALINEVFQEHPVEVVEYICSPITGIQRFHKHPPDFADVVAALDGRREFLRKSAQARGDKPVSPLIARPLLKPEDQPDGYLATVTVPDNAPQYADMVERSKDADRAQFKFIVKNDRTCIVVPLSWLEAQRVPQAKREWKPWTPDALLQHYGKREEA